MLKKVTTQVTYKIPALAWCNEGKTTCRFCISIKGGHRCALYNDVLGMEDDRVLKTRPCVAATCGHKSVVEDVPDAQIAIGPNTLITAAIDQYIKIRKSLVAQGYPEVLVDKLAKEYMLGGKK